MKSISQGRQTMNGEMKQVEIMMEKGLYKIAYEYIQKMKVRWGYTENLRIMEGKILYELEEYGLMANKAVNSMKKFPESKEFYIQAALAMEMLGKHEKSRKIWLSAPYELTQSAYYHYNLAKCEIHLGYISSACYHIRVAISISPDIRYLMLEDSLLMPFVESAEKN